MLVSILIPVFNRIEYIEETIYSALKQTYTNIEIIVFDNFSTDGTWEKVKVIAETDKRLRVFQQDSNVGAIENWKSCIEKSRGSVLKILWSDDLINESFIEETLPYLKNDVSFVMTNVQYSSNVPIEDFIFFRSGIYSGDHFLQARSLGLQVPVSPGCAIFWKKCIVDNFIENIPNRKGINLKSKAIGTDLLFFLLSLANGEKFAFVNKKLSYFRVHNNSITIREGNEIGLLYHFADLYAYEKLGNMKYLKNLKTIIFLRTLKDNKYNIKIKDYFPSFRLSELDFILIVKKIFLKLIKIG